jgi:hypothetical protein
MRPVFAASARTSFTVGVTQILSHVAIVHHQAKAFHPYCCLSSSPSSGIIDAGGPPLGWEGALCQNWTSKINGLL